MIKVTIEIPGESYHFSGAPQEAIDAIRGMMGKEPEVKPKDPEVKSLKAALYKQYQSMLGERAREANQSQTYTWTTYETGSGTVTNAR